MSKKNLVQTTTDEKGREIVMVRADKMLEEMMVEKPMSRWDVKYWHPKYDYLNNYVKNMAILKEYIVDNKVISADTIRASRGESYSSKRDKKHIYRYLSVEGIRDTGYDDTHEEYGSENAYNRLRRSELKFLDIALARSGTGSLGKSFIFLKESLPNIVSDLYIVRCDPEKINPFYITTLLKTRFGKDQIERNEKGVSGQTKLTTDMIEHLLVPGLSEKVQNNIESEYKKISNYHDKAMGAKKKNNNMEYKKNIEISEEMLKDLISKTEAVIRGEKKDVI